MRSAGRSIGIAFEEFDTWHEKLLFVLMGRTRIGRPKGSRFAKPPPEAAGGAAEMRQHFGEPSILYGAGANATLGIQKER